MSKKQRKKIPARTKKFSVLPGKLISILKEKAAAIDFKRLAIRNIPYVTIFYLTDKTAWLYRHCIGDSFVERAGVLFFNFQMAFSDVFPAFTETILPSAYSALSP